ncbi:MAG: hypothetical protein BGP06_03425 [Rhizobiales bacterium 65-9]|nr:MAG: hypothetical protein BGP06_03425 [Rhizobiales bacterium 65-9]
MAFRYAPYDGSKQPFSIGLAPLAPERWFEPDERLLPELALKDALLAQKRDAVFAERDDTRDSQAEILDAIARHLLAHHGERFSLDDDAIVIDSGARRVNLSGVSPLLAASLLVQDDLCLMRQDRDGWRLVAASLCFPSSWSLGEKFNRR